MSLLAEKVQFVERLMDQWELSAGEKNLLLPENPTEEDCDGVYTLACNLASVCLYDDRNTELSTEKNSAFQRDWLRTSIPVLGDKTPLGFVSGKPEKLAELIIRVENPHWQEILRLQQSG